MPQIPGQEDPLRRLERIVDDLVKGSPLDSSAISQGLLQFIGGKLQGLAGAAFEWIGSITTKGPWTNEGTLTNTGKLMQNGDSDLNGDVKITKTLDVTAETTLRALVKLLGDLVLEGDGKIVAGNIEIRPASSGGGGVIMPTSGELALGGPGGVALADNVRVILSLNVGENLVVEEETWLKAGVRATGLADAPTGTTLYSVVMNSAGRLYRGDPI